jgi:hypothetical protein
MSKKIDEKKAKKWAKEFRSKRPDIISSTWIPKSVLDELLRQSNVGGIRVYNAFNENDTDEKPGYTMIAVGTDATGKNLLPSENPDYSIYDDFNVCPPDCPPNDL